MHSKGKEMRFFESNNIGNECYLCDYIHYHSHWCTCSWHSGWMCPMRSSSSSFFELGLFFCKCSQARVGTIVVYPNNLCHQTYHFQTTFMSFSLLTHIYLLVKETLEKLTLVLCIFIKENEKLKLCAAGNMFVLNVHRERSLRRIRCSATQFPLFYFFFLFVVCLKMGWNALHTHIHII